ncbi:hypothetical protein BpHYR1_010915, partial [Brachionus plicatilis]
RRRSRDRHYRSRHRRRPSPHSRRHRVSPRARSSSWDSPAPTKRFKHNNVQSVNNGDDKPRQSSCSESDKKCVTARVVVEEECEHVKREEVELQGDRNVVDDAESGRCCGLERDETVLQSDKSGEVVEAASGQCGSEVNEDGGSVGAGGGKEEVEKEEKSELDLVEERMEEQCADQSEENISTIDSIIDLVIKQTQDKQDMVDLVEKESGEVKLSEMIKLKEKLLIESTFFMVEKI